MKKRHQYKQLENAALNNDSSADSAENEKIVVEKRIRNKSRGKSSASPKMLTLPRVQRSPTMDGEDIYKSAVRQQSKHYRELPRKFCSEEFPSFLKRLHVSSDESDGDFEVIHYSKKVRKNSADDSLPSFLKNLNITPESESENEISKKDKKKRKKARAAKRLKRSEKPEDYEEVDEKVPSEDEIAPDVEVEEPNVTALQTFRTQDIKVSRVPTACAEITVLKHPATITLQKLINVRVISGGVSIAGHEFDSLTNPICTIFSYKKTGLVQLTTKWSNPLWKTAESSKRIKTMLMEYGDNEFACKLLEKCDNSSVIIVIQRAPLTTPLKILALYYPTDFYFNSSFGCNRKFIPKIISDGTIKFTSEYDDVASSVLRSIRKSKANDKPAPRIMVFGHKNSGKSTLLQFIVNQSLKEFECVYYLDTDPGQCEFTPPGVVSLTKVDKCIIGPAFTHLRTPEKMIFIGDVTPASSPPMYLKSINELIKYYYEENCNEPLFINTMGWMSGIGLTCLEQIMEKVDPTIVIEMLDPYAEPFFKTNQEKGNEVSYHPLISKANLKPRLCFEARELRDHSVLAYFGYCIKQYERPMYLNEVSPYCIKWDDIAIYDFTTKIVPFRIIEAINCSFVALCIVDESLILQSDIPGFQRTLNEEPENICLGFGIVRAVDETNHLLHVITPLPLDELQKVNAIIKGNVKIPTAVYIQQPVTDIPLPFMDAGETVRPNLYKLVKSKKFLS